MLMKSNEKRKCGITNEANGLTCLKSFSDESYCQLSVSVLSVCVLAGV